MDEAFAVLKEDVDTCLALEARMRGTRTAPTKSKSKDKRASAVKLKTVKDVLESSVSACGKKRKQLAEEAGPGESKENAALSQYARFTDAMALDPYKMFLHYVPRLVNVVTLAEALPVPGSGLSLPLNLQEIAAKCTGAFYAPRRFAAVQLAYSHPRCRVLIFHTGRLVGTGTSGAMAARLAIARAQRQLGVEAGVHLNIRNFSVINQVGAASLRATLNCDAFATAHSSTSHFDRSSFVGLAWRPPKESICCEIYSTGRANLPGSVVERQLQESFSRMLPELLRFSSANALLEKIPEELQAHHRVAEEAPAAPAVLGPAQTAKRLKTQAIAAKTSMKPPPAPVKTNVWDGWADADDEATSASFGGDDQLDLSALGL
jgi:TATA-box binding protein (TBP) (component of TFIID and TFIIIB)